MILNSRESRVRISYQRWVSLGKETLSMPVVTNTRNNTSAKLD